jgi:hypothetical protein
MIQLSIWALHHCWLHINSSAGCSLMSWTMKWLEVRQIRKNVAKLVWMDADETGGIKA